MAKILTFQRWLAMKDGGAYFLQGFSPAWMGSKQVLRQEWKATAQGNPGSLVMGFTQDTETGLSYASDLVLYFIDNNGDLYKGQSSSLVGKFAKISDIQQADNNNPLLFPDVFKSLQGDILYTTDRYVGRGLSGADDSSTSDTTTMHDADGDFITKGVVAGATLYNSTDKSKGVITTVNAASIVCAGGFSGGLADHFDSGNGYIVYADKYADLGAAQRTWSRQIFVFNNTHYIGNGNVLASLDATLVAFSASVTPPLTSGYIFIAGSPNANMAAVAANMNYKGAIHFWNGTSPYWSNVLFLDNQVDTIKPYGNGWIYNSGAGIYFTDGNSRTKLGQFPDTADGYALNIAPNGLLVIGDKAIFSYKGYGFGRIKSGFWVFDITRRDWTYVCNSYQSLYAPGVVYGGLFFDAKNNNIFGGYQDTDSSNTYRIDMINQNHAGTSPSESVVTLALDLGTQKQISKIEIDWTKNNLSETVTNAQSVQLTLSLADNKRHLWGYGQTNAVSTVANHLKIDNSVDDINKVRIGDEIIILTGANSGERAFVTTITGAKTSSCVVELDRSLTGNTASGDYFNILPYKKCEGKVTFANQNSELYDSAIEMATFVPKGFLSSQGMLEVWIKATSLSVNIESIRIFTK